MEVSIVRYYCTLSDSIKNNKNLTKEEIDSLEEIENEYLKLKDKCFELESTDADEKYHFWKDEYKHLEKENYLLQTLIKENYTSALLVCRKTYIFGILMYSEAETTSKELTKELANILENNPNNKEIEKLVQKNLHLKYIPFGVELSK